jgi:ribonuclease-3
MDNDKEKFAAFATKIGVTFNDLAILREAFTHRSYLNEHRGTGFRHNERLEFLGDAILELAITDYLFHKLPDEDEGKMTAYRSALVNTNSISDAATAWGMNEYLLLSRGEAKDSGRARAYILANTFEAVIGAIYLDRGYDVAREFVSRSLFEKLDGIIAGRTWQDAKSRFQEAAQEKIGITPHYVVEKEVGPDHDKQFTVAVFIGETRVAQGNGRSKQDAEQAAAGEGLRLRSW